MLDFIIMRLIQKIVEEINLMERFFNFFFFRFEEIFAFHLSSSVTQFGWSIFRRHCYSCIISVSTSSLIRRRFYYVYNSVWIFFEREEPLPSFWLMYSYTVPTTWSHRLNGPLSECHRGRFKILSTKVVQKR